MDMKNSRAIALAFLYISSLSVAVCAQTSAIEQLQNGGFEITATSDTKQPASWSVDGIGTVYLLDESVHRNGKYSLKIGFKDGANKEGYSGTMQRLSTSNFAGKRVEISAYLRRTSEASKVGIWALVSGQSKKRLVYINSYEQPLAKGSTWSLHKFELNVPREAISLALGAAIHESDGEMWVDDVSIRVVESASK
jgi:hypothetical protein